MSLLAEVASVLGEPVKPPSLATTLMLSSASRTLQVSPARVVSVHPSPSSRVLYAEPEQSEPPSPARAWASISPLRSPLEPPPSPPGVARPPQTQDAVELSPAQEALVERFALLSHDVTTINEKAELLKIIRLRELARLEGAMGLLERESAWRQQRANALQEQLQQLSQRKLDVLAAHIQLVQAQYAGSSSRSEANIAALGASDAASLSGKKPPQSVLSDGRSGGSGPREAASERGRRARGKQKAPQALNYACGPLTKKAAATHYAAYWQRQAALGRE